LYLSWLWSCPAAGAGPAARTDNSAAGHLRSGVDLYIAGQIEAARAQFSASVDRLHTPRALAYLIVTDSRLGNCDTAAELHRWLNRAELDPVLRRAVAAATGPDGCAIPDDAKWRCNIRLRVTSEPPQVRISTTQRGDGPSQSDRGRAPVLVNGLCPGHITLTARRSRFRTSTKLLLLEPGRDAQIALKLAPIPADDYYRSLRKYGGLGVVFGTMGGGGEGGRWHLGDAFSVGGQLMAMLPFDLRAIATMSYLRSGGEGGLDQHALSLRGQAAINRTLHWGPPGPGLDSRWLTLGVGGGAELLLGTPRGVQGFVDGWLHVFWFSFRGFVGVGSSFGLGKEVAWSYGMETSVILYL